MVSLYGSLAERIRHQAAQSYPNECCGALLGAERDGWREVLEIVPLENRREDGARNRFSITPDDVRAAEQKACEAGLELIGWYHSHPDHPARPSEYDREHAWPWYSYVIVSVKEGIPKDIMSWRLAEDRSRFDEEKLEVTHTYRFRVGS